MDLEERLALLRGKLQQLKISISNSDQMQDVEEFQLIEDQVRTMELEEAHHARRIAIINWLGQGDEPSRFYFATLKAKRK